MTFAAGIDNNRVALENDNVQRVVDTCCLGCVFAHGKYETDNDTGKLRFFQSRNGCRMNVLGKLKKQGQELQDSIDQDGNEFYVIGGRACPFHRTPNWKGWGKAKQDIPTAMAIARTEVQLKPDIVIYIDDSTEEDDIRRTIHSLNQGQIRPAKLYLINNSTKTRPSQIMKLMEDCPFPWRAETVTGTQANQDRALDIITAKCTGIFVTYFYAGYEPPLDFFVPMDIALHDNLDRFVVLEPLPDSINCMTILRNFYKQAGGNARTAIVEKAKKISKEQKCQYLVRPVTEIVTQLSR